MKILDRIQFAKDLDFLQLLRVLTIFPQFNSACITITYPFKDDRLLYKKNMLQVCEHSIDLT